MTWDKWTNGILGLWVVASAFVGFSAEVLQVNLIITGVLLALTSFGSLLAMPGEHRTFR
jgi:hypothetical protein